MKQLRQYQIEGVRFCLERDASLIGDDPGLGKTLQSLAIAHHLLQSGRVQRILIVVPASLIPHWEREIEDYFGFTPCVFHRARRYVYDRWIYLATYNSMNLSDKEREHWKRCFPPGTKLALILDEAHLIKNKQGLRNAVINNIRASVKIALTGTPSHNKPEDVFGLLNFLNPVEFPDKETFQSYFCVQETFQYPTRFGPRYGTRIVGHQNLAELNELLKKYMIRRLKDQVASELLSKNYIYLPYRADEFYERILDQVKLEEEIALTKLIRLQEALSGLNPYEKSEHHPTQKFQILIQLLLQYSQERVIVWFSFFESLKVVAGLLMDYQDNIYWYTGQQSNDERELQVELWKEDPKGIMLATIAAGGIGQNWQEASTAIYYELSLSPGMMIQSEDRIHRIGQTKPCFIYYLYALETVEQGILETLIKKRRLNYAVTDDFTPQELEEIYSYSLKIGYIPDGVGNPPGQEFRINWQTHYENNPS